tara:strand:- start:279 stop:452 length:174 start_codon:yes stop_codon:yes gene_type:complete
MEIRMDFRMFEMKQKNKKKQEKSQKCQKNVIFQYLREKDEIYNIFKNMFNSNIFKLV